MSFSTGGLFHRESVKLASLYLDISDWTAVRHKVISENTLQARTLSTLQRVGREVVFRLQNLNSKELGFLITGSYQEQTCLLWIAVCRQYRFIADFAVEVLRERFISLKLDLHHEDFDAFFNRKAEWQSELDRITPTTRTKLRQVLFRMLREADLLSTDSMINAAIFSPRLLEMMYQGNRQEIFYFPVHESDLKGMAK